MGKQIEFASPATKEYTLYFWLLVTEKGTDPVVPLVSTVLEVKNSSIDLLFEFKSTTTDRNITLTANGVEKVDEVTSNLALGYWYQIYIRFQANAVAVTVNSMTHTFNTASGLSLLSSAFKYNFDFYMKESRFYNVRLYDHSLTGQQLYLMWVSAAAPLDISQMLFYYPLNDTNSVNVLRDYIDPSKSAIINNDYVWNGEDSIYSCPPKYAPTPTLLIKQCTSIFIYY